MPTALPSVRTVLRGAVTRFNRARLVFGHGTHTARDEAAYLVLHAMKLPPDRLAAVLERRLTAAELAAVRTILRERIEKRLPAAYLTNEAWLGAFRFFVDERVIVPRSFIAELLRSGLAPWVRDAHRVKAALDLCTGSGCLAILAAHAFPDALVDGSDLSPLALQVARRNVRDYVLGKRVRLIKSDLFAGLGTRRYDVVISNPPYVKADSMRRLPREYRSEPTMALGGGKDGLSLVLQIITGAARHLNPGGLLVVEIGHNRAALERRFPRMPFIWLETSAGSDFVFLLRKEDLPG